MTTNPNSTKGGSYGTFMTATRIFAYTLAVRMIPYVLSRFGFQLDTDISIYPWNIILNSPLHNS